MNLLNQLLRIIVYLFYIEELVLSLISMIIFGKLILFHFIMDYFDKQNYNQSKINPLI